MERRTFILAASAALLLAACGREKKLPPIARGETVLAFGDSVTYGTGAARGEDWPSLLAEKTGWRIVNAGIPGDTAQAGKERIQDLLDEHAPRLVLVEIGGNDFLRRRAQSAVKEDVHEIVRTIRAAGADVVLIAVPELSLFGAMTGSPTDAPIYAEIAAAEGIPLVRNVFSDILGQPGLVADRIHPNAKGYRRMAEEVYEYLRERGVAP